MQIRNPFDLTAVPRKDFIIWADREKHKEKIMDIVASKPKKYVETLTLLGDYGQGKTHSMLYAYNECKKMNVPAAYISNPGDSFIDLMRKAVRIISFDEVILSCNNQIEKNKKTILEKMKKGRLRKLLTIEELSIERMIQYAFPEIDADLAIVMGQVYNNRNLDLCRTWLFGGYMTRTELGRINVSRSISSDDYAVKILSDVLRILISDRGQFILFIDEVEDTSNLSASKAISYFKSLRRFIDENVAGLKIVTAWLADAFRDFGTGKGMYEKKDYRALYDRLKSNILTFDLLDPQQARAFILDFIKSAYSGAIKDAITDDAITILSKEAKSPRDIITTCYMIFDAAIRRNTIPIDAEFVNVILAPQ